MHATVGQCILIMFVFFCFFYTTYSIYFSQIFVYNQFCTFLTFLSCTSLSLDSVHLAIGKSCLLLYRRYLSQSIYFRYIMQNSIYFYVLTSFDIKCRKQKIVFLGKTIRLWNACCGIYSIVNKLVQYYIILKAFFTDILLEKYYHGTPSVATSKC